METLYNQVSVEGTSTVEEHEKKIQEAWKERSIEIQGDKLSLICAYLHAPDDEARSDLYGDETELEPIILENERVDVYKRQHLARSLNGKYLYSIADEGVAVFAIAPDGDLTFINKVDIDGMRGCHLSTDEEGKYLYVAGYHDGKVTVVHTHQDGRLGSVVDGVFHRGLGSVAERNFRPHVSCVRPTPDNKYLCAVDNGIDQMKIYRVKARTNRLELVDILRCQRESRCV